MTDQFVDSKRKPLILIAEDIPKNMEVVCNILRKEGYRLAMAGNGRQALEMAPLVRPDLILLDIMMPEANGYEVCEKLKANPEVRDIPVIFLTAKVDTDDVVKGFELGAVDYVTKPFKGAELVSRVRTHLELTFARRSLKTLNATKDKFFSIIAHDLRDPLQYLLLSADFLQQSYDDIAEKKRKDYIRRFYDSSHRISSLLENLLNWSRSQSGSMEVKPEPTDAGALVREAFQLSAGNAKKKDITLSSSVEPGVTVYADPNMLHTLLRNLVSNAVKFTPPGGEVKVAAADSPEPEENFVHITVSDNGIGIPAEDIDSIFRIDVRKTRQGTAKEKGTGLGLILCKEFVDRNNGTISVSSEPGKGTTFTVTLPKQA